MTCIFCFCAFNLALSNKLTIINRPIKFNIIISYWIHKVYINWIFFTCVAEGESRSRSAVTPSVCLSVRPKILSSQLLWNYWSIYHETWNVDRTSYGVMHIGRKFWSPHFSGSYAPWNLENICKSTNNLSFLCQFFINEITASDVGPDIIRSHLFTLYIQNCNIHALIIAWTTLVFSPMWPNIMNINDCNTWQLLATRYGNRVR